MGNLWDKESSEKNYEKDAAAEEKSESFEMVSNSFMKAGLKMVMTISYIVG